MLYKNDSIEAILAMERMRTGNYGADCDDGIEEDPILCPICESEADYFYENIDSEIVGCNWCIEKRDLW